MHHVHVRLCLRVFLCTRRWSWLAFRFTRHWCPYWCPSTRHGRESFDWRVIWAPGLCVGNGCTCSYLSSHQTAAAAICEHQQFCHTGIVQSCIVGIKYLVSYLHLCVCLQLFVMCAVSVCTSVLTALQGGWCSCIHLFCRTSHASHFVLSQSAHAKSLSAAWLDSETARPPNVPSRVQQGR